MTDTDVTALIAGGAAAGGTGFLGWRKRRQQRKDRAEVIARRLFPRADEKKLARETANILRHRRSR